MTLDELKKYPVAEFAANDCALFLWVTDPLLPEGIEVMRTWGFAYKTIAFHWVKLNKQGQRKLVEDNPFFTGLGYWTRANPEICLLGTKGKPKRQAKDVRRLLVTERQHHSQKPLEVHSRVERLVSGPYLELFARECQPGWDAVGNEIAEAPSKKYRRRQPSKILGEGDTSKSVVRTYDRT